MEIGLVLIWAAGFIPVAGFGILSYVALWCHFLALHLWPAVGDTLIGTFSFQWFVWFVAFTVLLSLKRIYVRSTFKHEKQTG